MKLFETKISPYYSQNDIAKVIESGDMGFGSNVSVFELKFAEYSSNKYNIATNSASAAAFILFAYYKEKYGKCDVYTPSFGFTSVAWAAKHHGHDLIFVDVDNNMLFDIDDYRWKRRQRCERYSDGNVKPIVMPVLYGGVSTIPNLTETLKSDGFNEIVILDSAHCVTPKMKSDVAFFSFHPYKPIASSDGGMISTDNKDISEYAQSYRNFGRQNTSEGYQIVGSGFKFYMNNLNATIALTQLEVYNEKLEQRKESFAKLKTLNLKGRLLEHDLHSSYYIATLIADDEETALIYRDKYVNSRLYPPLHKQPYYIDEDIEILSNTEDIYPKLVNLPLYNPKYYE